MTLKPNLGGTAYARTGFVRHSRLAELSCRALFDLDESDAAATPGDDVDLTHPRLETPRQDAIPLQTQAQDGNPFSGVTASERLQAANPRRRPLAGRKHHQSPPSSSLTLSPMS